MASVGGKPIATNQRLAGLGRTIASAALATAIRRAKVRNVSARQQSGTRSLVDELINGHEGRSCFLRHGRQ